MNTSSDIDNLIVGSTSQLSYYFPKNFIRISSRDMFNNIPIKTWDTVYLCFGENRTFLSNSKEANIIQSFYDINYQLTLDAVNHFMPISNRVVVYSTAELWSNYTGPVSLTTPYNFNINHYTLSKYNVSLMLQDKKLYSNVNLVYPFNFNGIYRNGNFLFGKIFDSIINKIKIQIGDTYFFRDIIHPSFIAKQSQCLNIGVDSIMGSGNLIHVNSFIRKLYKRFNLNYEDYVEEIITTPARYRNSIFYSDIKSFSITEEKLFETLILEIESKQNENRSF